MKTPFTFPQLPIKLELTPWVGVVLVTGLFLLGVHCGSVAARARQTTTRAVAELRDCARREVLARADASLVDRTAAFHAELDLLARADAGYLNPRQRAALADWRNTHEAYWRQRASLYDLGNAAQAFLDTLP